MYEQRMPVKKTKSTGLRIQLQGLRTTQELRAMVQEAIDNLEALGITHIKGGNLYVTPADPDGHTLARFGPGHTKIDQITIEAPYPSVADEHGA